MLRVGPPTAAPAPPAEDMPPTPPEAPPEAEQPPDATPDQAPLPMMNHKVPQMAAGYLGAEYGPFTCSTCVMFEAPDSCSIVDGAIEADGVCNVWTSPRMQGDPSGGDSPDQDPNQALPTDEESTDEPPVAETPDAQQA